MTYPKGYDPSPPADSKNHDYAKEGQEEEASTMSENMNLPRRNLILWLLVSPFVSALISGGLLYIMVQNFPYLLKEIPNSLNIMAAFIIGVPIVDGIAIFLFISFKIYNKPLSWDEKTWDEKTEEIESSVNDLQYAPKFFYILIFVIMGITVFFFVNAINEKLFNLSLSSPALVSLSGAVIALVIAVIAMGIHFVSQDFEFHVAKMSVHVVGKTDKNEDKRMRFLRIVLNSYNKFIEKKLRLEYDTARVFSMILTATDKDKKIKEIVGSFDGGDKFKPVTSLSDDKSEPFFVRKRLWTNVNEVGTFLAVIIPALIAIAQVIPSILQTINP
jgi:hypothetical protein